jgi:hypothetical protein
MIDATNSNEKRHVERPDWPNNPRWYKYTEKLLILKLKLVDGQNRKDWLNNPIWRRHTKIQDWVNNPKWNKYPKIQDSPKDSKL